MSGSGNLLWKYLGCKPDGGPRDSFLDDRLFRVTQPAALNDPFEMKPRVVVEQYSEDDRNAAVKEGLSAGCSPESVEDEDMIKTLLAPAMQYRFDENVAPNLFRGYPGNGSDDNYKPVAEFDAERAKDVCGGVERVLEDGIGVLSLTRNPRQLLMWSHYGQSHRGVAVGFDRKHPFFEDKGRLLDVEYNERRVSVSVNGGIIRVAGKAVIQKEDPPVETFLRKAREWSYEEEVRLVVRLQNADERCVGNEGDTIYLVRVPADAIKEVVLGANVSAESVESFKEKLSSYEEWSHVRLYQASLSEHEFRLHFLDII